MKIGSVGNVVIIFFSRPAPSSVKGSVSLLPPSHGSRWCRGHGHSRTRRRGRKHASSSWLVSIMPPWWFTGWSVLSGHIGNHQFPPSLCQYLVVAASVEGSTPLPPWLTSMSTIEVSSWCPQLSSAVLPIVTALILTSVGDRQPAFNDSPVHYCDSGLGTNYSLISSSAMAIFGCCLQRRRTH